MPIATKGYAAQTATSAMEPFSFTRRDPGPRDIQIDISYCGVCHSDLHQVRDEWKAVMPTVYPCVPGHEIVGRVTAVGRDVEKLEPGDLAAVGCMVDSCRACSSCKAGFEQYCLSWPTLTYNAPDKVSGGVTYGGFADAIVVDESFVLRVPGSLQLAAVAPLLCAGITTYSPLRHWQVGKGKKVGIVGLGGLGHLGLKFARAFGAHTVLLTTSPSKAADAQRLGADEVVHASDSLQMAKHVSSFDFILDTASAEHDLNAYLKLLKLDGTMTLVGAPQTPAPVAAFNLLMSRRRLAGSSVGGIRETQEMLTFCAEHDIVADIELIPIQDINQAFDRLRMGDVRFRFVIDMASLRTA